MLPDGFIDLVMRVIRENPLKTNLLNKKDTESLWEDFTWGIFLKDGRRIAIVTYIRDVLWDEGLLDRNWILNHSQQEWKDKTNKTISEYIKLNHLDGRKKGALEGLLSDLSSPAKSLQESAAFFKNKNVSAEFLRDLTSNTNSIWNFLSQMSYQPASSYISPRMINPNKISNIGIVKALLWLQYYGLTKDFCPPSGQIKSFVESYLQKKQTQIQNFSEEIQYILQMQYFNNKEVKQYIPDSTTRDAGLAVWYWKSTQGLLLGVRFRKQLTPKKLLMYLDLRKMDLNKLDNTLNDIDKIDNLAEDIKNFLDN